MLLSPLVSWPGSINTRSDLVFIFFSGLLLTSLLKLSERLSTGHCCLSQVLSPPSLRPQLSSTHSCHKHRLSQTALNVRSGDPAPPVAI